MDIHTKKTTSHQDIEEVVTQYIFAQCDWLLDVSISSLIKIQICLTKNAENLMI